MEIPQVEFEYKIIIRHVNCATYIKPQLIADHVEKWTQ